MKHETRIRTLETKNKEQEKMLVSKGILLNNNGHNDLDPDEVWDEVSMTNQDIRTTSRYNKHQEFGSESNSKKALCAHAQPLQGSSKKKCLADFLNEK